MGKTLQDSLPKLQSPLLHFQHITQFICPDFFASHFKNSIIDIIQAIINPFPIQSRSHIAEWDEIIVGFGIICYLPLNAKEKQTK